MKSKVKNVIVNHRRYFFVCFCDLWWRKRTTSATVLQLHRGYNQPEQHELFPMATLQNTKRQRIEGNLDASCGVCNKCIFYGKNGTFITLFLPLVILVLWLCACLILFISGVTVSEGDFAISPAIYLLQTSEVTDHHDKDNKSLMIKKAKI